MSDQKDNAHRTDNLHNDNFQRFLQRLDHELKNPLTAIRFALANLALMVEGDAAQSAVNSIKSQTLRISQILTDVRKLADLDRLTIERIPVNVSLLLNDAVAHAQTSPSALHQSIDLNLDCLTPDTTIDGDRYLLLVAIFNVIENALKFSGEGGNVVIQAEENDDWFAIQIIDDGLGIADQDLKLVWEELYRASATRHIPGSGLGLAMVKTIIERHGGEVSLESEVNIGTIVTLKLPL